MSSMHLIGCLFFVVFVAGSFYLKQDKRRAKTRAPALPSVPVGGNEGERVELLERGAER